MDADETENGKSREYEGCKENKEYREYGEYREQVQAMLLWYDRYIRLKLTGDENELASAMTVYPTNGDAVTAETVSYTHLDVYKRQCEIFVEIDTYHLFK